jgi:hypothetical protein
MEQRSSDALLHKLLPQRGRPVDTPLRTKLRALFLAALLWVAWSASFVFYRSPDHVSVIVGQASPRNIKASRQVSYISEVKTQEARATAVAKVDTVYVGPNRALATQQLAWLEKVMSFITALRYDPYTTRETKLEIMREIPGFSLSASSLTKVLDVDDDAWNGIARESLRVLDLIMREEIRAEDLVEAKRRVQNLTNRSLTDRQQELIVALAQQMIVANSQPDAAETLARQAAAQAAVEPVRWSIQLGESLLREGEIVTNLAYEKLQVSGLIDTGVTWQETMGILLFNAILVSMVAMFVVKVDPLLLWRPRRELLLIIALLSVGLFARLFVPGHTLLPYLFPAAAAAMVVAAFLNAPLAIVISVISAVVVGYNANGSLELMVYVLLGSVVGTLSLTHVEQLTAFMRAMLYMALAHIAVILAFWLSSQQYDALGLAQLLGVGVLNAIVSAILAFVAYSFTGKLFGITTPLQLLELARPTHPLFRQLLIKAPGTYHHSIVISNMAERAAETIGADALLARVGSYYHDIGKTSRPYFFAENQTEGDNPHDKLDPKTSAEIIISHTIEGLELADKYKLPEKVRAFIPEHHGTTLVTYFFRRANQQMDGQDVEESDFRYPGPKPQSRESAIVMLADGIEAWSRANRPSTQAEMERLIRQVMNDRLVSGQLDECDLTLKDLDRIRESFVSVLQGIYHPRIQYPERTARYNGRNATAGE